MPVALFLLCDAALLVLAVVAILLRRSSAATPIVYGGALVLSLALLAGALVHMLGQASPAAIVLPIGLPWVGANFRLDALSAFFLVVINLGAAAASLYGLGYGHHEHEPQRVLPFFPAFLAGMNLVLLADDAFHFPGVMGVHVAGLLGAGDGASSGTGQYTGRLRLYCHGGARDHGAAARFRPARRAAGGYAFAAMRANGVTPGLAALVLVLALIGAGSKAGLAPLHVWLPLAHPAAPSHVSALMSGVMTKVAVYGFVRIVFDLLGTPAWWWGALVMALGAGTAVLGVLHALMQNDLKRVLAYSTIENIGLIFAGLGLALAFKANGFAAAAALATTAALFHVLNHAIFKSLLFFGAGAVLTSTGERGMERLGGLLNRMPATGFFVLVGAAAISALPPLNGFASDWLLLQSILLSPELPHWGLKILAPAVGATLALAAALAAACFVRVFGVAFLGRPRSPSAESAHEVDSFSVSAMGILAALCLLAGIFPAFVIDKLAPAVRGLTGAQMPMQEGIPWLSIAPIAESRSSYNGLLVFVFIAASASLTAFAIHQIASNKLRRAPAWDCGFPDADPATQYTPESFAQPIRRVFGAFAFRAHERVDMPAPGEMRAAQQSVAMHDLVWEFFYLPVVRAVEFLSLRLNHLQFLTIRQYLSVVFGALVSLLLVLASWP